MYRLYTVVELSEILHMSYRGVLRLIKQGRIKAIKIGKQYLVPQDEFERITKEGA